MRSDKPTSRPLSIAFICLSQAWGGLEIMVTRIAKAFAMKGHRVFLVSPVGSAIETEAVQNGIRHLSLTPRFKYLDPAVIGDLARFLRGDKIEVAVATLSKDISSVVLAGRFSPHTKLAYLQQMQFGHSKRDPLHRWSYGTLASWITLTHAMKSSVLQNTIVKEDVIDVVPIGTNRATFDPKHVTRAQGRKAFQLPTASAIVGFIGRLDVQKGCEEFVRAAAIVRKSISKALFVVVGEETRGEPGYGLYLRGLADSLGLKQHIRFLPFTNQVPLFLASLDVLAVPSYSETFGYVAIEGMAMGVPVVGTNAGGLPEIIVDGETGILVSPKSSEGLAAAIRALLSNPRLRKAMSTKGRARVKERFDFRKSIELLEQRFQRIS